MSAISSAEISSDDLDAAFALGEAMTEDAVEAGGVDAGAAAAGAAAAGSVEAGLAAAGSVEGGAVDAGGPVSATGTIHAPAAVPSPRAGDPSGAAPSTDGVYEDDVRSGMHLAPLHQEVILAPESESCFWEGLDGELGVFIATFAEGFHEGQELRLLLTVSDGRAVLGPFDARARVVFLRAASDRGWPGAGLVLLAADEGVHAAATRLAGVRQPLFWA